MSKKSSPSSPDENAKNRSDTAREIADRIKVNVQPDEPTQFETDASGDRPNQAPPSDPEISPDYSAPRDDHGRRHDCHFP